MLSIVSCCQAANECAAIISWVLFRSPALKAILSSRVQSLADPLLAGYGAFCHLVFVSVWTSPGRSIDMQQLLRNVRK